MTRKDIIRAIEKTELEILEYRADQPNDHAGIRRMYEYKDQLEERLSCYHLTHPSPLRAISTAVIGPLSCLVTIPAMAAVCVYVGGRIGYEELKTYFVDKQS